MDAERHGLYRRPTRGDMLKIDRLDVLSLVSGLDERWSTKSALKPARSFRFDRNDIWS
jgi:hypothetical protein